MNKTRKTYGIKGFMEYQAVIKVGKSRMKVPFSGGSMNAMGIIPCTFSTEKYMTQHAIENSKEFKDGLIYIVSTVELEGNVEIERPSPRPTAPRTDMTTTGEQATTAAEADSGKGEDVVVGALPSSEPTNVQTASEEVWPAKSAEDAPLTPVEFASNDEAKDYLEQNFGLVRSKLRNREDIYAAGKANGVEIIFI